jgi:hypothetical protein
MLPWPGKRERRAAVDAARAEHHASRASAAQSRVLRQQINRLAEANGYASAIEEQIRRGHRE